jgi:hypothetical protein
MPGSVYDHIRQNREKRLAELFEEQQAAYQELGQALSEVDKVRIKRRIEGIEREMEEVESSLRELESVHGSRNQRHPDWETHLPQIDFAEAREKFEKVVERLDLEEGGAAFFLLQNCRSMGGKWCVPQLKKKLDETADFRDWPIDLPAGQQLDERVLLGRLGQYLGCQPFPDEPDQEQYAEAAKEYAEAVVDKMCHSVQSGTVVFIGVTAWDMACLEERFLPWFVRELWVPLVRDKWPRVMRDYPLVKLIVVIAGQSSLATGHLPPALVCSVDQFDCAKIVELPLYPWTLDEIRRWLLKYSGLTGPPLRLTPAEIEQMARDIHGGDGQPMSVYGALMDEFRKRFR